MEWTLKRMEQNFRYQILSLSDDGVLGFEGTVLIIEFQDEIYQLTTF